LEENVYRFQGAAAWGLWLIRLAGAAFFLWTCTNVDLKAFTGLRQASGSPEAALADDGEPADARRLNTSGPYGIVRHPMYTAAIVMLFTEPHMTIEKLLFAVFATVYFAVGSVFEERRLIDVFGQEYLDYRERTPRLVPGFVRPGRKP
jgi:methanethiol S-methyltransferase